MQAKKVLVIAVHPDDETLGCAGTLLKLKKQGAKIYWLIVTRMAKSKQYTSAVIQKREKEIKAVTKAYGFEAVYKLGFPTATLDQVPLQNLIKGVSEVFSEVKPDTVFLPNRSDAHSDHKATFQAAASCLKQFRYPFLRRAFMYETISETEFGQAQPEETFVPNAFCDVSNFMDQKIKIMRIYESEMGEHPFPRSEKNIRALATFRGAMANVGSAESFMTLKEIF